MPRRRHGEEFVLFLNHADSNSALLVAERPRQAVARVTLGDLPELHLSASLGVAWPYPEEQADMGYALIRRADQALYLAKHLGRNRVCTQVDASRRCEAEVAV